MPRVEGSWSGWCRVSVTKNESPGCDLDRCRTGREFSFYDLSALVEGLKFYRYFDGKRVHFSTERFDGADTPRRVTIKNNHVKMTIMDDCQSRTPRQQLRYRKCEVSVSGDKVDMVVTVYRKVGKSRVRTGKKGVVNAEAR